MATKIKIILASLFFCILCFLIYILYIKDRYGYVEITGVVVGLKNEQTLIAYTGETGALNRTEANVSFLDKKFDWAEGDIFRVYGGDNVKIEKVSIDTVRIIPSFSGIDYSYIDSARGITFIYDFYNSTPDSTKRMK